MYSTALLYINSCFKFQRLLLKMYAVEYIRNVIMKMNKFNMFITAVCVLFLIIVCMSK